MEYEMREGEARSVRLEKQDSVAQSLGWTGDWRELIVEGRCCSRRGTH